MPNADDYMQIRIPSDLKKRIKQQALAEHRTMVGQVLVLIEKGMAVKEEPISVE